MERQLYKHEQEAKKTTLRELKDELQLAFPRIDVVPNRDYSYFHSNDHNRYRSLIHVEQLLQGRNTQKEIRVGMFVGTAGWQSMMPQIHQHLDVLLFTDSNPRIASWIEETSHVLQESDSMEEYNYKVYRKDSPATLSTLFGIDRYVFETEKESYNALHFLSSEDRYTACRRATQEFLSAGKVIIPVTVDLSNNEKTNTLGEILGSQSEIIFADMTNVAMAVAGKAHQRDSLPYKRAERRQAFAESLSQLPFTNTSIIQFSLWNTHSLLVSRLIEGLDNYLKRSENDFLYTWK